MMRPWLRMGAVAWITLLESVRRRVFWILALFAVVMLGAANYLAGITFEQEFQFIKDTGFAAISVAGLLLALMGAAQLIPGELERRTLHTALSKPLRRWEFVAGKYAGLMALVTLLVLPMAGMFQGVLVWKEGQYLAELAQRTGLEEEARAVETARLHEEARDPDLWKALLLVWVRLALVAALAVLVSTVATSTEFIVFSTLVVYLIGHLLQTAREAWSEGGVVGRVFTGLVGLLVPDFGAFTMIDDVLAGQAVAWGRVGELAAYGLVYAAVCLVAAAAVFEDREL